MLLDFVEEYGHSQPIQHYVNSKGFSLGSWVSTQRAKYRSPWFPQKRKELLESLPGWSWDRKSDRWNKAFEKLKVYTEEKGDCQISPTHKTEDDFDLGRWTHRLRNIKGALTKQQIKLMESLPGWSWDPWEDLWNKQYKLVKKYSEEHGTSEIPRSDKTLYDWTRKQIHEKNILNEGQITLLEALPKWNWDFWGKIR